MKMVRRFKRAVCGALAFVVVSPAVATAVATAALTALPAAAMDFSPVVLRRADTKGLVSELFLYDLTLAEVNQLRLRLRTPQPSADDAFSRSYEPSLAELVPELSAGQSERLLSMLRPVSATRLGQQQDTVLIVFQGSTLHARRYRLEGRLEATASAPFKATTLASVAAVSAASATPATSALRPNSVAVSSDSAVVATANSDVLAAVQRWAQAWAQRNVATYAAAYERDFRGAGGVMPAASNAAWLAQRRERILSKRLIEVELEDLQISMLPSAQTDTPQAQARFVQRYRGDALRNVSRKRLTLALRGGNWLIREEVAQ